MKRYKCIVTLLSLTDSDESIIRWTSKITKLAQSEKVIFIHPMDLGDIPAAAREKYPWLAAPIESQAEAQMKTKVDAAWDGDPSVEIAFQSLDRQSQALAVLEVVMDSSADLVVICRGAFGNDLAIRLARKAPCSVMAVPRGTEVRLRNVVVPIDFSDHAKRAVDVATAFASAEGLSEITSIHVYSLDRMSHRATISKEELSNLALEYAEKEHNSFFAEVDTKGITVARQEINSTLKAEAILSAAKASGSDLIVIGSRGKNTIAALLLGSTTEELMRVSTLPVIAAKDKGAGLNLVKALLGA